MGEVGEGEWEGRIGCRERQEIVPEGLKNEWKSETVVYV